MQRNQLIQSALWVGTATIMATGQEAVGVLVGVGAIAHWHLDQITARLRDQSHQNETQALNQQARASIILAELNRIMGQLRRVDKAASATLQIERRKLNMWDNPSGPQACTTWSGPHRKPGH